MSRPVALVALLALVVGGLGEPSECLLAPVAAPVDAAFEAPECPYCAGHRGVEYATSVGDTVGAASAGTVSFAGSVAGVRWVVVDDLPGRKVSYGHLRTVRVVVGQRVELGDLVGTTTERLYLGVRQGAEPVDPTPLLQGFRAVAAARLVPSDATPGRPAPVVAMACATGQSGR